MHILYKQKTCEGCLPACLLILVNKKITLKAELNLLIGGFKRNKDTYAAGIIKEFTSSYHRKVKVYIHSKYFFKKLQWLASKNVQLEHNKISLGLIEKLGFPFVIYVDDRILRNSVHWPHFVVVERKYKNRFALIDPWSGGRKWLTEERLMEGILSLKNYLKFCPLLITVD